MASCSKPTTVENQENTYQIERKIGKEIQDHVRKLGLPFKLDKLTEGQGNCFPIAVIQQCRRPEVMASIPPNIKELTVQEDGITG